MENSRVESLPSFCLIDYFIDFTKHKLYQGKRSILEFFRILVIVMIRLFSRFDLWYYPFLFSLFILSFTILFSAVIKINLTSIVFFGLFKFLREFFSSIKPKGVGKVVLIYLNTLFLLIFFFNLFSVVSFNFAFTSQVRTVLTFGLSLWLGLLLFHVLNNAKGFLSHSVPEGCPLPLTFFLFLIELVSCLIRPITLTVRLTANILAGHLLIILLSKLVLAVSFLGPLYVLLNVVEFFVSLIQAYIIVTMLTLYYSEIV